MQPSDIAAQRLARQGLANPRFASATDVVRFMGAVQAQEYDASKWGLGQRCVGETDASVEQALSDGAILRTHILRPTWHFVAREDIRWLMDLTAPRVSSAMAYLDRLVEVDEPILTRCYDIIERALADAGALTRAEIQKALAEGGIEAKGQRLGHIMFHAEFACVVVNGPRKGKQHAYALFEQRAPGAKSLLPDEALAELTRRFFTSHGPATPKDMATWATMTLTDVRRGLEMLGSAVESFEVAGRTYWQMGDDVPPAENAPRAHLLQGYDDYVIPYFESKDVFGYGSLGSRPPGRTPMTHALIIDGRVAGHWRRAAGTKALVLDLQLYRRLDASEREAVEAAVQRYAAFVGVRVALGTIDAPVT